MQPLNNWNNITPQLDGEFAKVTPGGYICRILNALDVKDKGYLELSLDIASGEFEGFYHKQYKQFGGTWGGTWKCKLNVFYTSNNPSFAESTQRKFKGLITSIEESNNGYKWNWNEQTLKGLYLGVLFGEEEFEKNDGTIGTAVKPRFARSVDTIKSGDFEVPKFKPLKANKQSATQQTQANYYAGTVDIASDDLPF